MILNDGMPVFIKQNDHASSNCASRFQQHIKHRVNKADVDIPVHRQQQAVHAFCTISIGTN